MSRPFALLAVLASILFGLSAANAQSFDPNNPAGSGYSRIFFDDFSGPLDTTKWSPTWPWGGGLNSTYPKDEALPDDITFSNGAAQFLVKKQRSPSGKRYSTSTASTYGKFFRTFGYFEASIKLPANARGLWPPFWLLPEDGSWPPEIDVMEWLGNGPNTIYLTLHYGANNSQQEGIVNISGLSSGFHRFGVLWTPTSVVWYIDGIQKYSTTTGVPTKDMFVVLNNDTGGWNGNAVDKSTVFPAILSIDYVAVWAPPGG